MIDLAIIIVNWNVRSLLQRCLASIYAAAPRDVKLHVIVVDNASADGSAGMVRETFPQVQLIANQQNMGFTRGNNQALMALGFTQAGGWRVPESRGTSRPRYVLLLNPDTEVVDDALAKMVTFMDAHPDVGVVGPQLLFPDGTVQSSRRRFPTLATAFLESTVFQQWWHDNPVARRYYVLDRPDDAIQDVDWVVGACMMIRGEAIEQAGLLDEGFFMYSEELDWCRRIKDRGWRVVYLPTARVIHHEGKSSEQVVPARHIHFQRSKVRYFRKHHGRLPAMLLRFFLLATYAYQIVLEGGKWLVGHKRPLRRERVAAYWQVIRSGL
ncbi:MAG: glycosyltransferase family 2 protein [Chloroflexi bacterium]|nr:MAG: glycosyltransferase family 2 protein [Chloroflexota bacterium]